MLPDAGAAASVGATVSKAAGCSVVGSTFAGISTLGGVEVSVAPPRSKLNAHATLTIDKIIIGINSLIGFGFFIFFRTLLDNLIDQL
jgi:hypothetical protein